MRNSSQGKHKQVVHSLGEELHRVIGVKGEGESAARFAVVCFLDILAYSLHFLHVLNFFTVMCVLLF